MFNIKRSEKNPILSPNKNSHWEAMATFNPSPVKEGKNIHLLYRAMSEPDMLEEPHISRSIIGHALSKNGEVFIDREPLVIPELDYEKYGCEDPRVTKLNNKYYIFYTALSNYPFNADGIKVAVATTKDLKTISEKHLVTPFNAKAMALFPEKINGKFAAILTVNTDRPPSKISYAEFNREEDIWSESFWNDWYKELDDHEVKISKHDDDHLEVGAPPLLTKYGWLLIYSHIEHYLSGNPKFGVRAVLLDKINPKVIIGELRESFLVPEAYYEKNGMVPNIVFPTGSIINKDKLEIYYGAADTFSAKLSVDLEPFVSAIVHPHKGLFNRFEKNPILEPRPKMSWEAHGVFNPAAIEFNGKISLIYRAMSDSDTSALGYAETLDGEKIKNRSTKPIYIPREQFELKHKEGYSGCEDPRLVLIKDTLYMTYTAFDGETPKVAVSTISKEDFINRNWKKWSKPELITPPEISNKDACIIPEKTKNGYVIIHRVNESICADLFPTLDFSKEKVKKCIEIIAPRRGMWDGQKVGLAAPPIKTKKGWLTLYHGVSDNQVYRIGAILLDLKDPTIVIGRTTLPIFEPEETYEVEGVVPNVVFPCGTVKRKDKLYIYYGGADRVVALATVKISDLLKTVL